MITTPTLHPRNMPPPTDFGAPPKFSSWRAEQLDAVLRFSASDKRFFCAVCPTGSGKSLLAAMCGTFASLPRVLVLTATKSLQKLYNDDFAAMGLFDVRGQNNYECVAVRPGAALSNYHRRGSAPLMVDRAPCHAGIACRLRNSGCDYYDAVRTAAALPFTTTNYSYWLALGQAMRKNPKMPEPLGKFDLLVLDEAHAAQQEVCRALRIELQHDELLSLLSMRPLMPSAVADDWQDWGISALARCNEELADAAYRLQYEQSIDQQMVSDFRRLKELASTLEQIAELDGEWVIGHPKFRAGMTSFDPVWPKSYCEELLFRASKRVLLLSATIRQKTLDMMGVDPAQCEMVEYRSGFPKERRPVRVLTIEPRIRVDKHMKPDAERLLVARIDSIIGRRLDRKGIVHCVSYERSKSILRLSRYAANIITHGRDDREAAIARFKAAGPGTLLMSPSVTTGEDFPGTECEYIVIPKLPFVDTRDPVMKKREEEDENYGGYLMIQTLVQSAGRGMRSADDRCEVIVLDDHARWALPKFGRKLGFAPTYFNEAVEWCEGTLEPLPKL